MRLKLTENPGVNPSKIGTLYGYLNNLAGGRYPTPAADFYPDLSREAVASLSLQMTDALLARRPALRAYEWGRLPKYGAQGGLPSFDQPDFQETADRYYRPAKSCNPDPEVLQALEVWFSTAELEPYSFAEVISRQRRDGPLKTSSGLPDFTKREAVIDRSIKLAQQGKHFPAVIGERSIRQGIRTIYMYDFASNLQELQFVYAIMDWLMENTNAVAAWAGKSHVEEVIQDQFPEGEAVTHLSGDFSKMDTTVQKPQIEVAIRLIRALFKRKHRDEVERSLRALYSKPAIMCAIKRQGTSGSEDERRHPGWWFAVTQQNHGLFSGSGWTNCVETVLNFALNYQVARPFELLGLQVNGDDSEFTVRGHIPDLDVRWTAQALEWGFDANVEKQFLSYTQVHYLQLVYDKVETRDRGVVRGSYPALLAVNSAKNPERWISIPNADGTDRDRAMEAVRLIAIGNNCAGNPAFEGIVKFFVRGSPTRCGLDLPDSVWSLKGKARALLWEHGVQVDNDLEEDGTFDVQTSLHATPFFQTMMKLDSRGEI